ncbi:MAG: hypothetical protein IPJ74_08430 [Saprospiraceae bacterium]|nr:hypothetical protein [Saprospiraceae bacterium]
MRKILLFLIGLLFVIQCFAQQTGKWDNVQSIYLEGSKIRKRQDGTWAIHLLQVNKNLQKQCINIKDTELDDNDFTLDYIFADGVSATQRNSRYRLGLPMLEADMLLAPENAFLSPENQKFTIEYNPDTKLPERMSMTVARAYEWYHIEPVKQTVIFKRWKPLENGALYPMEWEVMQNGDWAYTFVWQKVQINPTISDTLFRIPDDIKTAYQQRNNNFNLHLPENIEWKEIAHNIWLLPYQNNVTVIRQHDGLIILEAPVSPLYSEDILSRIQQKFSGLPIKALIITSPIPSHIAGLAPYFKKNIKIYCLSECKENIIKLFPSFITYPLQIVKEKITIGAGDERMELFPSKTFTNRLLAYFPNQKLLYASELGQSFNFPGWEKYTKHVLEQVVTAVQKQKLEVNQFFGLHLSVTNFAEMEKALHNN